jgi:deoxyribodipyrimidine photo-lyase
VAVPSLGAEETTAAVDEAFRRHTSPGLRLGGSGVAVVWFRNDLRVLDNEALARAWAASEAVLPVYCVDPRVLGGATHRFGFPKTGGERPAPSCCIWGLEAGEEHADFSPLILSWKFPELKFR